MNSYHVKQMGTQSYIVEVKHESDGFDPAILEFETESDAQKWIEEQKSTDQKLEGSQQKISRR